jgi:diaminopimelate decarboxylase
MVFSYYGDYFAVKTIPNPQIIKILDTQNTGFDFSTFVKQALIKKRINVLLSSSPFPLN